MQLHDIDSGVRKRSGWVKWVLLVLYTSTYFMFWLVDVLTGISSLSNYSVPVLAFSNEFVNSYPAMIIIKWPGKCGKGIFSDIHVCKEVKLLAKI